MRWISPIFFLLVSGITSAFAQAGHPLIIGPISIEGNRRTKAWVIERELTFLQEEFVSSDKLAGKLRRSRDNIYNLGLFTDVRVSPILRSDTVTIIIEVNERSPIRGTPVLDFRERNSFDVFNAIKERRFTRLVYGGDIQLRSLSGRNETLSFSLQGGFVQKLECEFRQPAFSRYWNLELRLGARVQRQQEIILGTEEGKVQWYGGDSVFLQRGFEAFAEVTKRFALYDRIRIGLMVKRARYLDLLYQAKVDGVPRTYLTNEEGVEFYPSLLLAYERDHRDVKNYPMSGFKLQGYARFSGPSSWGSTQFAKFGATWAHHIPIRRKWNFAYGIHQVLTLGNSVPYFDQHFIGIYQQDFAGFSHELRGYDPFVIAGTSIHMSKAELKFAIIPYRIIRLPWRPLRKILDTSVGLYLTAFCDVGYVSDQNITNQDPFLKNQLLIGYGPGLNLIGFYDMLVRIEYARNHLGVSGMYINATVPIK